MKISEGEIKLLEPILDGDISFEKAMVNRRSIRTYLDSSLTFKQISQLLFASYGITDPYFDFKTAPSAGALYPLTIYLVTFDVKNLSNGIYEYIPKGHKIKSIRQGDFLNQIYQASLNQDSILNSKAIIIIGADYDITRRRYGINAEKYVHMEAGHVGQNIYLQAQTLGLGTVAIGAFYPDKIKEIMKINENIDIIYMFPIGIR